MDHYGIIGYPLSHSFSPEIHNTAFEFYALQAHYSKLEIPEDQFDLLIPRLKRENWQGFNVTIPYKERIIQFLEELDPLAEQIGAVNTIKVLSNRRWIGFNTDYLGFLRPIQNHLKKIKNCLLLGAGGAAQAVGFGLLEKSEIKMLTIVNRSEDRGQKLIGKLAAHKNITCHLHALKSINTLNKTFDLIINTTSIGMGESKIPLNPVIYSHEGTIVYDLIYNPPKTEFLKLAEAAGLNIINGIPMLIGQASESFELWTGKQLPLELQSKLNEKLLFRK